MTTPPAVQDLLRDLAPQVLAALLRRYRNLETCEDAVQEAMVAAADRWSQAVPDDPASWLIAVANRRMIDQVRSERARRGRERRVAIGTPGAELVAGPHPEDTPAVDDSLQLLLLCCHAVLSRPSQIALTLRAVGGLSTKEIAAAFFVPPATMGQRISRAKQQFRQAGATFDLPTADELPARLDAVMKVLYLIFTEGHTATSGPDVHRVDLSAEAIRLARQLVAAVPHDAEARALLALMLLVDARRPARVTEHGDLVPLEEQDRTRWDKAQIDEGVELVLDALRTGPLGPYQLQAAINAVHDEAPTADATDWAQVLVLYDMLDQIAPSPTAAISRAIAHAKVHGPAAGLRYLDGIDTDGLSSLHRLHAARAHLLEQIGDCAAAHGAFQLAARLTTSIPEKRHFTQRARRLAGFQVPAKGVM